MDQWLEDAIVGMIHLPPLPGAPDAGEAALEGAIDRAKADARALDAGGIDGVMIENFGDAPFYRTDVPKHTVASMTRISSAVADAISVPIGINVLRNDPIAAMSIATAVGADYIRVNVHSGVSVTDQGIIQGQAHETVRLRERLNADVAILADVDVKHATALGGDRSIESVAVEAVERGHADGVICSGSATGESTALEDLRAVRNAFDDRGIDAPVLAGSGVTPQTIEETLSVANGAIVGTALKENGRTTAPVEKARVAELVENVDRVRQRHQ